MLESYSKERILENYEAFILDFKYKNISLLKPASIYIYPFKGIFTVLSFVFMKDFKTFSDTLTEMLLLMTVNFKLE